MAYTHQTNEIIMTPTAASVTASGAIGNTYDPGLYPVRVVGMAVVPTTSGGVYTSMEVSLNIIDTTSGSTASAIDTVYGVATDAPGHVIYSKGLNTKCSPGQRLQLNCDAAATTTAAAVKVMVYVQPQWDEPGNNSDMRQTT